MIKNGIYSICALGVILIAIASLQSCDDKMKKLVNTKWTLEKLTTEYGQVLIPKNFYTVFVQGDVLSIQLDANMCRLPYAIVGKDVINVSEKSMCTRRCCDSNLALSFLESMSGDLTIKMSDDKLVLIGKDTMEFHLWTKNDVKREKDENFIKIKRTGCFGTCPIYEMTLFNDGSSSYIGKRFVNEEGHAIHQFDRERIKTLFDRAEKLDFKSLNAEYDDPNISDMETVFIEYNNTVIKVRYKVDAPKALVEFITDVHKCAIDAGWVSGN
jgi:hypothetical protein